jgi:hypothetical protein
MVLLFGAAATLQAERPIPAEKTDYLAAHPEVEINSGLAVRPVAEPVQAPSVKNTRAMGTITYDDGVYNSSPGLSSFCYGNQFNTFSGNSAMVSGSVTALDFFIIGAAGTDNVFLSVFGPVTGTSASVLTSVSAPLTGGSSAWNNHVFATPVAYPGSSFLAGVWYIAGDTVGLATGTTAGQGHHGMLINDVVGTGFQLLTGVNAMVRASGDVLPVELMSFTIQ